MPAGGRRILGGVATLTVTGGYLIDWNRTHLFNPAWPPHAKFHDAQTVLLGTGLGMGALYALRRGDLERAALLPTLFWAAVLGSFAFPGTAGGESEAPDLIPTVAGVRLNEGPASALLLAVTALGYSLARRAAASPA
jgi:hypothetical protein